MTNSNKFEQFTRQVQESLPQSIRNFCSSIEKKIRQILINQINKINLVNREEFDKQIKILSRTCEKLDRLEIRLNNIENIIKNNPIFISQLTSPTLESDDNQTLTKK